MSSGVDSEAASTVDQKPLAETPWYSLGSVVSADGTTIGYRRLGRGPAILLVHGGMMTSRNFMKLGTALADRFTVYIPDRRGRASSGGFGDNYGVHKERDDIDALMKKTGAQSLFGLSSGAIILLHSALTLPIRKLVLYEPPILLPGGRHDAWGARYEREISQGRLGSALATIVKESGDRGLMRSLPRFLLVPLLEMAIRADAKDTKTDQSKLKDLVATMRFDLRLVAQTEGALEGFRRLQADVLLLGGRKSARYLADGLDALERTLPKVRRVELRGVGHVAADERGKPELVAAEVRRFFG